MGRWWWWRWSAIGDDCAPRSGLRTKSNAIDVSKTDSATKSEDHKKKEKTEKLLVRQRRGAKRRLKKKLRRLRRQKSYLARHDQEIINKLKAEKKEALKEVKTLQEEKKRDKETSKN
ncbi:hypothetical protein NECAME_14623 [Necator americanus]|uniref:Uncharacterized protein n=1 Tax=Necator americanus TaxID=51031 RepID=W2SLU7_NECAM|nr:hypothetical protein NECAME_14623 [Necator americanus]ETN70649.1 hypothetical protein NECAME_14623 [Necator americanus]